MKHSNVAIFVPHRGCPNQCTFCNQLEITGCSKIVTREDVVSAAETAMNSRGYCADAEIAFFGGSFTGIEPEYMESLLSAAFEYVSKGLFKGIRISTRPDYINQPVLDTLKCYGVTSIELGAQSMDDEVLQANKRGHTAHDVEQASNLIRENSFSLGLQMMTGLYKTDEQRDIRTAQLLALLKPETMRIYPTIVLKNTELANLCESGQYIPQQLDDAVDLCAKLLDFFDSMNINVIRLGLHDSESLKNDYIAGPYHPAFRELCESRRFLFRFLDYLDSTKCKSSKNTYKVEVSPQYLSKAIGQKRSNIDKLREQGINVEIVPNKALNKDMINIIPIE